MPTRSNRFADQAAAKRPVDGLAEAIERDLLALAELSDPGPGVTRLAWSPRWRAANDWLEGRMRQEGLAVWRDAACNIFAEWQAGEGPAVLVGSHIDTVPGGGRFDGALGVVGALHAVSRLRAAGFRPARPIRVVSWADEEGVRFGTPLFGSRAFLGRVQAVTPEDEEERRFEMGRSGADLDRLGDGCGAGDVDSYLELHVELGPVLEEARVPLAVVSAAVGIHEYVVELRGETNHAGTTPMRGRRDAAAAAARIILQLRERALERDRMTVTVGRIETEPGATNAIAGLTRLSVDIRTPVDADFDATDPMLESVVAEVSATEQVEATITRINRARPLELDPAVALRLIGAAEVEGVPQMSLATGGGHDAIALAEVVPTGMLLVPSRGGLGHCPEEYTEPHYCALGVRVLQRALSEMAS